MKKTGLIFKILTSILCLTCLLSTVLLLNSCGKGTRKLEYTLNTEGTAYSVTDYKGSKANVTVPAEYKGLPVTSIGEEAFKGNETLKSITLPDSVETLGDKAFADFKNLETIDFPSTLKSINFACFQNCAALTEVTIPDGLTKLPVALFDGCSSLETVNLPASLSSISYVSFIGCDNLENLTIAEGNTTYYSKDNCIIETATKKLVVGAGNSVIPSDGSVTAIGEYAFYGKQMFTTLDLPEAVKVIESFAFFGCSELRYARLAGVTEIGDDAFSDCHSFRYILLPKTLKDLGASVFSKSISLKNVYYLGTAAEWGSVSIKETTAKQLETINVNFYSETKPETEGNFWHYGSDNTLVIWEKEQ